MRTTKLGKGMVIVVVAVALVVALLPSATPARAITAFVGRFYATCATFAVDVAVNGTTDDGGGFDRFRYYITDGNNKKLYSEDVTRQVGVTKGNAVTNVSYDGDGVVDGPPGKNPIRIQVIDLNNAAVPIAIVAEGTFDAKCLGPSGVATFSADFSPPVNGKAVITVTTPLYGAPGGPQLGLNVEAGKEFIVVYKSLDSQWISIFVGSSDLPWIPVSAASVNLVNVPFQPSRIDTAGVIPIGTPIGATPPVIIITPIAPTPVLVPPSSVSGQTTLRLRLRQLPTTASPSLAIIPSRYFVPVYGKDTTGRWVKVAYNNIIGWVSVRYIRLSGATLNTLPVVQ